MPAADVPLVASSASALRDGEPVPISQIMKRDPLTIGPDAPTTEAIATMRSRGVGCLPVVKDGRLVGMVTARSLMGIVARLLEEKTQEMERADAPMKAARALATSKRPTT